MQLYHGDCLEVMKNIQKESIDAVITDIPYFVTDYFFDKQWRNEQEYLFWCEKVIAEMDRVLKENSSIILFTGRQYNRKICTILDKHFQEQRIIIWYRKRFNTTRGKALASSYEPICYYTKGNAIFHNVKIKSDSSRKEYQKGSLQDGVSLSDVWIDIPALPHNSKEKVNHPTQKPIALMERCISICTNEKDTVLDFCMGSGATGVACEKLKRNFIGIEINQEYYELAQRRIKNTAEVLV